MPRYFFNIRNDTDTIDEEGKELAGLDAAIDHATTGARSLAADTVTQGRLIGHHRIEIVDCDGELLHTVRFDEAVDIQP
jgi:hypothetical protein